MTHERSYIPFVSIIIPVYNAESTLSMCLESIRKLDYPQDKFEVIVIDNGSNDGSIKIAGRFEVKMFSETFQSSYAARNKGIKEAKGELIAFTDADCVVTPGWLKNLVKEWDDKSIGCFAGEIEAYQPKTLVEKFSDRTGILGQKSTLFCSYLPYAQTANSAYRREVFDKVGLFNTEIVSGGDADIAWRMQKRLGLKIEFVPEALVYHKHRTSIKELYNQFKKYEHGKILWHRYYSDYKLPTFWRRTIELMDSIVIALLILPYNMIKYLKKEIDIIDFTTPFFKIVMCLSTFTARLKVIKRGSG